MDNSCGKFDDRMGAEASRNSPWADGASDFPDAKRAIDVDQVDGESHPECVDGLAGNDPETAARRESVSPKETFGAFRARASHLELCGQRIAPRRVCETLWRRFSGVNRPREELT